MGSLYTVVLILTLPYLIPASLSNDSNNMACQLDISHFEGVTVPGDVSIGFLYPLHLTGENLDVTFTERPTKISCTAFWSFQATMFAIEEINDDPNILPNVSLGLQAYDTCNMLHLNVKATLQILTGLNMAIPGYRCLLDSPLSAILGPSLSTQSMTIAHILGLNRLPQISWWSTSPLLSNRKRFPSFFRTVPSDRFQSSGIAQMVKYFGWSWIGLVASDNDYGQQGIQLIGQEIVKAGACVEFSETILMSKPDRNAPHIVNVIKRSTAKAVVLFCSDVDMALVLDEWLIQNISKKILIASESWSTVNLLFFEKYSEILIGTIGLALTSGILPNFEEYLNKITPSMSVSQQWVKLLWENAFKCTFSSTLNSTTTLKTPEKECTGTEKLSNVHNVYNTDTLISSYNVYIAVRALAKALDDLGKCSSGDISAPSFVCAKGWNFKPWQLLYFLKKVRIRRSNGREFYFDENGDPPAAYDIVNWQLNLKGGIRQAKVGSYDTTAPSGEFFTINKSAIMWSIKDYQV
ncbi:extracellular calcium-sensing receptor-like isoform X2 [Hyperolius riggenbachi]|uniref:extracellular calcium-sensing receptor-like isoform X2 n=1 Tax=Hyperolius riggenbachi TaxID=752182 RepID=UPI0035A2E39B